MKEYLFTYGLFRDAAKGLLENAIFCGKTNIIGKLYKVNEFYPGFVKKGISKVVGDVYLINPSILPMLDEFEGDEYIRIRTRTSTDIECWVYEYKYDISDLVEISGGDWMLR